MGGYRPERVGWRRATIARARPCALHHGAGPTGTRSATSTLAHPSRTAPAMHVLLVALLALLFAACGDASGNSDDESESKKASPAKQGGGDGADDACSGDEPAAPGKLKGMDVLFHCGDGSAKIE